MVDVSARVEAPRRQPRRRGIGLGVRIALPLLPGASGILDMDGVGARLRFTVRNRYGDAIGVIFDQDDAGRVAIRARLDRLPPARAAA